jgi:serine phosphatase RsbU (regulator of sigma subunit)
LPAAYTCEAGSFTLSAWLEPAETIGGDTFDYSLDRDRLHLSVTDAVGHGVDSALMATLCVGSL